MMQAQLCETEALLGIIILSNDEHVQSLLRYLIQVHVQILCAQL